MTDDDLQRRIRSAFDGPDLDRPAAERILARATRARGERPMRRDWSGARAAVSLAACGIAVVLLALGVAPNVAAPGGDRAGTASTPPKAAHGGYSYHLLKETPAPSASARHRHPVDAKPRWLRVTPDSGDLSAYAPPLLRDRSAPPSVPGTDYPDAIAASSVLGYVVPLPADTLGQRLGKVHVVSIDAGGPPGGLVAVLLYDDFQIAVFPRSGATAKTLAKMVSPTGFDARYMEWIKVGANPALAWSAVDIGHATMDSTGRVIPGVTINDSGVALLLGDHLIMVRGKPGVEELKKVAASLP